MVKLSKAQLKNINLSHLANITEEYFDEYGDQFCDHYLSEQQDNWDAEIPKSKLYACKKRLKKKDNRKLMEAFVQYIVHFKKPYLFDKLITCPQLHYVKGFDFRPLVKQLKIPPNIGDYSEALRDRDKVKTENEKLRQEYYDDYKEHCEENNLKYKMDEVPDIYNFYFNDKWNVWKGGSYRRDFYLYKESSRIQHQKESDEIKEEFKIKKEKLLQEERDKKSKLNNNAEETINQPIE